MSSQTYEVTIDANTDYNVPAAQHMGTYGDLQTDNIQFFGDDIGEGNFGDPGLITSVSVPAWPLPAPWTAGDFGFNAPNGHLTAMCAVYHSGGYR